MSAPFAWGINPKCQLAAAYHGPPEGPVSCTALPADVVKLDAGYKGFTGALTPSGDLLLVGGGVNGALAQGDHRDHFLPVKAKLTKPVIDFDIAAAHWIAHFADGTAATCGANAGGQLGIGTSGEGLEKAGSPKPVFPVVSGVVEVRAGGAACACRHSDGTVSVFGAPSTGLLGDGRDRGYKTLEGSTPSLVPGLDGVAALAVGGHELAAHVLALMDDGTLVQWGSRGGCGSEEDLLSPTPVAGVRDIIAVAAGPSQSFAIDSDLNLYAWGVNFDECLWLPESVLHQRTPVIVREGVQAVSVGYQFAALIDDEGVVDVTGRSDEGQHLGQGFEGARQIACGEHHTVVIADHERIEPPIRAKPIPGGLEVSWMCPNTTKRWEVAHRPALKGAKWSPVSYLSPEARATTLSLPSGELAEVRVRSGVTFPTHYAVGIPA